MRAADLAAFIKARESARLHKEDGRPYSADPIIAKYRFCNMVRADDRVTRDIFAWAARWTGNPDHWFAFVVARLFNNPTTLDAIAASVLPFKPQTMRKKLMVRKESGAKLFNAAYIVSTNGLAMDKVQYVIGHVLTPLWAARKNIRLMTARGQTLAELHECLCTFQGMGSFMAAQVIADLKYFDPYWNADLGVPTAHAPDWWTFAASGPGSRRGLNRVMNMFVDAPWREATWRTALTDLHNALRPLLPASVGTRLSAQDVQNCLCEFDKYERARLGEGVPKQIYKPYTEK